MQLAKDNLNINKQIYVSDGINKHWIVYLKNTKSIIFRKALENNYKTKNNLKKGEVNHTAFPI